MFDNLQFDIICHADVATLTSRTQDAFEFFHQHNRNVFLPNQRLVLYSSHLWPDDLVIHLYQATALIDISNCFVLLAGPQIDQQKIIDLCPNDQPFETFVTDQVIDTQPIITDFKLSDCLCPLPWTHLEIDNKGSINACCASTKTFGNINSTDLEKSFASTEMMNFRRNFLENVRSPECNWCWEREDNGLVSNRIHHIGALKKDLLVTYMSKPKLVSLDIKPGNTCNFKCRICNPVASSQHAQEQLRFYNIPMKSYNWADEDSAAMKKIYQSINSLANLDMYGGEPFLIKSLQNLVQHAVTQGVAPQMRLHYNSNGSIFPNALLELWPHFKHVDLQFSIDNVGKRFELERGGSWEEVNQNISRLVALNLPNVNIGIMPSISIMNIYYLDELLAWCTDLGLQINPNYVTKNPFGLNNLTNEAKKLIFKKFANCTWPEMTNILNHIECQNYSDGSHFREVTLRFDQMRNQNFCHTHPELASAMGMC